MKHRTSYHTPIPDVDDYPVDDPSENTLTLRRSLVPDLPGVRPRVLFVEPEPAARRLGASLLDGACAVETASSAEDAFVMLCEKRYHVVVTDYGLAGRDGLWLLRFVERRQPSARRVLHCGDPPERVGEHLRSGLVHAHVSKPASRSELVSSVIPAAP